jgi:hypothetical protein
MKRSWKVLTLLFLLIVPVASALAADNLPGILSLLLGGKSNYTGPPLAHQAAIVGPLAEAEITAYQIESRSQALEGPVFTPLSDNFLAAGTFDLSLVGLNDTDWVVVAATGGQDIDHNGDGILDPRATSNSGTLHALAQAGDWRSRHLRITPLTELAWRFVENLIDFVSPEELEIRLEDLARYLIREDIDGNGRIDWYDILVFDPANPLHHAKLTTSYDWLSALDSEGHSIIGSLLAGNEAQMLAGMDETYTWLMTRFPSPDSRYGSVRLSLSLFGPGSASSDAPYTLSVDSTLAQPVYEDHIYFSQNEATLVDFTAIAPSGAEILSWTGCDTVSADLSRCTVSMGRSRSVVANFGSATASLHGMLHDLSRTENVLDANSITIQIPSDMTDMIDQMAAAEVDDFVVGDDGGGFLRRITAITQNSSTSYILDTVEANLEEVVAQGTGYLYKQLENSDLDGYEAPAQAGQSATISANAFTGLEGVRLVPSADPGDRTFTITLGEQSKSHDSLDSTNLSLANEVTLYDDGQGGTLTATGEITLDINLDTGFDFGLFDGLRSFKFITAVVAEESIELAASTTLAKFSPKKIKIGTLHFSPIFFTIPSVPPLPVWVTPTVDVYLFAEGKVEAQVVVGIAFSQTVEGGLLYNRDTGFSIHRDFSLDFTPTLPTTKINASLKGGLEASSALKIYSATGPAVPLEAYLKLNGSASTEVFGTCSDILVKFLAGAEASFKWDLSGSSKIGQLLHLDTLENMTSKSLLKQEWPIKEWTLFDTCPGLVQGSHLLVEGDTISATIDEGNPNNLATTLTITNTGDETLHWNTSGIASEVLVTPSSGQLSPGGQEVVQMSVATATLPVGRYINSPFFYNEASLNSGLPDSQFGNTYKTIDITVKGTIVDVPTITLVTSGSVGAASLHWDFSPSSDHPFVGFQIFATTTPADPDSYSLVYTTNIYQRQATISGFTPGTTYSFVIRAYSNSGANPGPLSSPVSVVISGNTPSTAGTVISAGQTWMDRNLGATRVATSMTDEDAYGDLYQWGRYRDGHEKRNSGTTTTLSGSNSPGHGNFILAPSSPRDWLSPQNGGLWQGVSGVNNPCPPVSGCPRIRNGKLNGPPGAATKFYGRLQFAIEACAGRQPQQRRWHARQRRQLGTYWSATVVGSGSGYLYFSSGDAGMGSSSVRA